MPTIRLYRSERGYARGEAQGPYTQVAEFLDGDVQGDLGTCAYYLDKVRQIRIGALEQHAGSGNGQHVTITAASVTLEHLYLDDVIVITLDQFEKAIQGWLEFLTSGVAESFIEL